MDPSTNAVIAQIDVYYDQRAIQGINFKYQTGQNTLLPSNNAALTNF